MDLTLADFVWLVLMTSGGLVVGLSLISRMISARAERRALADRVICRLCLHAFENHGHARVVACPHCGAANEKGRSRQLG